MTEPLRPDFKMGEFAGYGFKATFVLCQSSMFQPVNGEEAVYGISMTIENNGNMINIMLDHRDAHRLVRETISELVKHGCNKAALLDECIRELDGDNLCPEDDSSQTRNS